MAVDHVSVLTRLIQEAEAVVMRNGRDAEGLALLEQQLLARKAVPAERRRTIDDHTLLLCGALRQVIGARSVGADDDTLLWTQLAGVILPRVRRDLGEALRQRHEVQRD